MRMKVDCTIIDGRNCYAECRNRSAETAAGLEALGASLMLNVAGLGMLLGGGRAWF